MTHDEVARLRDAYLDAELDLATNLAVEAHISECERCAIWLEARGRLLARLRTAPLRYEMPAPAAARIRRQLKHEPTRSRRLPAWSQAAAAGIVLCIGGFLAGQSVSRSRDLDRDLVSAHVRSTLGTRAVDVTSSDHHTVKPWLSSQLPFSPPVPELSTHGDALIGGRVDYVRQLRVAAIVYRHGRHQVDVFVWPNNTGTRTGPIDTEIDGYRVLGTTTGAFTAAIVSDMSVDELHAFRDRWTADASER